MKAFVAIAICYVLQSRNLALSVDSDNVDYSKQDEWGGSCNTGYEQSPINIDTNYVIQDESVRTIKFWASNETMSAIGTNIGYTVQFNFSGGLSTIAGTGLKGTYKLSNLYFHWPSEHTVNGRHFPLEAHWIHYNKRYSSLEEAYKHEDGTVFLVTFYDVGAEEGIPAIDQFANAIESVAKRVGSQTVVESVTLEIPPHSISFYKYRGSRSVPPCTEDVNFVVIEEPVSITEAELQKITSVLNQDGKRVKSNIRHTQPLNGRKVYYRLQSYNRV